MSAHFTTSTTFMIILLIGMSLCHAETHYVTVQDNIFSPANINIEAGDTVVWENFGGMNHNVVSTSLDHYFRCANGCEDTGGDGTAAGLGWLSAVTFHKPESNIPYICEPHENSGMTGSVSVQITADTETVVVDVSQGFTPQELTIPQYAKVLFINGGGEHNIQADDNSFRCADGCRDDGITGVDDPTGFPWQVFLPFDEAGTFTYHCQNPAHNETGTINVIDEQVFANGFE